MRFPKPHTLHRIILAGLFTSVGTSTLLIAQPTPIPYRRPPEPDKKQEFRIAARAFLAPDVDFTGLGTVEMADQPTIEQIGVGTAARQITRYDDGNVREDRTGKENVTGEPDGGAPIHDGNTSAFVVLSNEQLVYVGEDGSKTLTAVDYHLYGSQADPNMVLSESANTNLGWELAYARFFGRTGWFGVEAAISFNGFDTDYNDEIDAMLHSKTFRHDVVQIGDDIGYFDEDENFIKGLEPLVDADGNQLTDAYGNNLYLSYLPGDAREEGETLIIVDPANTDGVTNDPVPGGAKVLEEIQLKSAFYTVRAGPVVQLDLSRKVSVNMGAGVTATYIDADFAVQETLINPNGSGVGPTRPRELVSESEWMVGAYVDANAVYQMTERMNLFGGMQYHAGSDFSADNDGRTADVDFKSQIYVQAGMGIKF